MAEHDLHQLRNGVIRNISIATGVLRRIHVQR
jgi:hypothetical protein